jgi:lipid A ethanolaminephosphotransferase
MLLQQTIETLKLKFKQPVTTTAIALSIALIFVIFYNAAFFNAVTNLVDYTSIKGAIFVVNLSIVLWLSNCILMAAITLPYLGKAILCVIFVAAASCAYFMDTYGVAIHRVMIQNIMETDKAEVRGLFNITLLMYIFFLGILPSLLLLRIKIYYDSFKTECWKKCKLVAVSLIVSLVLIMSMSADYASFFRNNKSIRQMANPLNFIYAGTAYFTSNKDITTVIPIENDAILSPLAKKQKKPTLLILVVGETARADHFGVNGYNRDTTPLLGKQNIITFTNVTSCGTETAVSVPCMFSSLGRDKYSNNKAKSQEGLLDVINHAGINVLWRDNNSGCKGTCSRVDYEDMRNLKVPVFCNERECFDDVLLHQLDKKIASKQGNKMIVLHQKGSHGPDYFNRYPRDAEFFTPVCKTNQLQDCTKEEVINAFDNTIRYTDHFLNSTIEWLKAKGNEYNTSLLYISDHGESLGENNLYLHGMPYLIAPMEQKHVPLFLWLSNDFESTNTIDSACLRNTNNNAYSHDNLFHTILGMLNVQTNVYRPELDILKSCRPEH